MIVGTAIIIATGVYTFYRERKAANARGGSDGRPSKAMSGRWFHVPSDMRKARL